MSIGDLDIDELVAAELIFREQWAREVGFDSDAADLVAATEGDEDINGGDAVDALCEVRELLDAALAGAPIDGAEEE